MDEITIQSELKTRSYADEAIAEALQKQVLIVPPLNITDESKGGKYQLVSGEASEIRKVLNQADYSTDIVLDKNLKRRTLVLKQADIVFPLILFAASLPLNVATGYIANWLSARFIGDQKLRIKYEHARFGPDGKIVDYVKLEGQPKEVAAILKSGKFESKKGNK